MKFIAAGLAALALSAPAALGADPTAQGVGFICGAEHAPRAAAPEHALMLAGVGNGVFQADTNSPQAAAWFAEGLNLYHAFNHQEARDAFARAAELDPGCALCEWGVSLGLGPTLNYAVTPDERALAMTHARRAAELAKDERTRALAQALIVRYGEAPDRDQAFGKAMDDLARRYPADDLVANVAAEALMIPGRGSDHVAVARAEELIKGVLARRPDDTAAIHYYIHASEFLGHPAEALAYAERLAGLAPNAGHLVHMAAHTLIHVGEYEQVAAKNAAALKADADLAAREGRAGPPGAGMYYLHNYVFGLEGALMSGDARLALKYADHAGVAFPATFDKEKIVAPSGLATTQAAVDRRATAEARALVAYARFAPQTALSLADRADDPPLVRLYRRYARGEALAARGDAAGVRREAEAIRAGGPQNADLAAIAADVLTGRAALIDHEPQAAAQAFARAAERQEKVFPAAHAFDPPPWWYPVRRSLAYADLAAGRPADAAREARRSLADWPHDAMALRVLAEAEAKTGEAKSAAAHRQEARKAWRGDLSRAPLALT
jgi:predicted Zn-dependent protease